MPDNPNKKKYRGQGTGNDAMEALHNALKDAWEDAKGHNKHGKELRVEAWYVKGENPLNWSGVVLVDDNDPN